jgi:hypothetical protein
MAEEHKEEVLSVAQQRSARKAKKAELLAFSALELEELTEHEILAFIRKTNSFSSQDSTMCAVPLATQ